MVLGKCFSSGGGEKLNPVLSFLCLRPQFSAPGSGAIHESPLHTCAINNLNPFHPALEKGGGLETDQIVDQDLFSRMNLQIRNGAPADHSRVLAVMPEWWGGRDLSSGLLKLFFIHFHDTIFIAERNSDLAGFLVGFFSQSSPIEAYIHLLGVHPDLRKQGIARTLYQCFFDLCRKRGRSLVRACTSPVNKISIEFHRKMGFQIEPGEKEIEGVPVTLNYLRANEPKVLFAKAIG